MCHGHCQFWSSRLLPPFFAPSVLVFQTFPNPSSDTFASLPHKPTSFGLPFPQLCARIKLFMVSEIRLPIGWSTPMLLKPVGGGRDDT